LTSSVRHPGRYLDEAYARRLTRSPSTSRKRCTTTCRLRVRVVKALDHEHSRPPAGQGRDEQLKRDQRNRSAASSQVDAQKTLEARSPRGRMGDDCGCRAKALAAERMCDRTACRVARSHRPARVTEGRDGAGRAHPVHGTWSANSARAEHEHDPSGRIPQRRGDLMPQIREGSDRRAVTRVRPSAHGRSREHRRGVGAPTPPWSLTPEGRGSRTSSERNVRLARQKPKQRCRMTRARP